MATLSEVGLIISISTSANNWSDNVSVVLIAASVQAALFIVSLQWEKFEKNMDDVLPLIVEMVIINGWGADDNPDGG